MTELGDLASIDVLVRGRVLVVPLGATEQHGPHLPLATDTVIAQALAQRLADRRPEVVAAPALPYGSSGEHQSFAGTLSIGQHALQAVLIELVRSATETYERVLLLCAHGGNTMPLRRAVAQLRTEDRDVRAWDPAASWSGDAHAGLVETSLMLALAPETVDMARASAGNTRPLRVLLPQLAHAGVGAVSPNGVLGDPTEATASYGQMLLDRAVDALDLYVAAWPDGVRAAGPTTSQGTR